MHDECRMFQSTVHCISSFLYVCTGNELELVNCLRHNDQDSLVHYLQTCRRGSVNPGTHNSLFLVLDIKNWLRGEKKKKKKKKKKKRRIWSNPATHKHLYISTMQLNSGCVNKRFSYYLNTSLIQTPLSPG